MAVPLLAGGTLFSAVIHEAAAQTSPNDVRFRVARFWRGEGRTLLEGVIGVPVATTVRKVELTVRDSAGKALYSEAWTDSANAQSAALAALNAETTIPLEVVLQPGLYGVELRKSEGSDIDSLHTQVRGFSSAPIVSDVVTSARMRVLGVNEDPTAVEMKRGRYAIERGSHVVVIPSEPKLWYYLELYRQGPDSLAQLEFRVLPQGKDSALVRLTRNVAVGARGTVDAAALPVQGLPPGDYVLAITAKSGTREERRQAQFTMASFETAAPAAPMAAGATASESTLYERYFAGGVRSDAEVNNMIEALTVGAPGEQVSPEVLQYTTDAKRRFLARYWSRVPDPNPATPAHELVDEYSQRVTYVTKQFSEFRGRAGVKTDKGRIYLKYGPADASINVEVSGTKKTVEIWKYTRRKSLKYVFVDETGFQNFNMVYTTDPQERTIADWQERVRDPEIIRQIITF